LCPGLLEDFQSTDIIYFIHGDNATEAMVLRAPDQGSTVDLFLFPRLKSVMNGASFADVAKI
jgi:hypothetical protein